MDDNTKREFKGIWIPKEIWLNNELSALDKFIFAEIDSLCGVNGCNASNEYIANFCHCSESMVSKSIAQLIKMGLVRKKSFDGRIRVLEVCLVKNASLISKNCEADYEKMTASNIDDYNKEKNNINIILKEKEMGSSNLPLTDNEKEKKIDYAPQKEKSDDDAYQEIFDEYNNQDIIHHRELNKDLLDIIKRALKQYNEKDIILAIKRYGEMYHSGYEYCNYKWNLKDFLSRKMGISEFLDEGSKWNNYLSFKNKTSAPKGSSTSDLPEYKYYELA